MIYNIISRTILTLVLVSSINLFAAAVPDSTTIDAGMKKMAAQIAALLKENSANTIIVNSIEAINEELGQSLDLKKSLIDSLKTEGITVSGDSKFSVSGTFQPITVTSTTDSNLKDLAGITVILALKNGGAHMTDISGDIEQNDPKELSSDIIAAVAPSGELLPPPGKTEIERNNPDITKNAPKLKNGNQTLCASTQSPFCMGVLRNGTEPMTVQEDNVNKVDFLVFSDNDFYHVTLGNTSDHDAFVELYIDGLSAFEFSQDKNVTGFIVKAKSTREIKGWHIKAGEQGEADQFQVVDEGQGEVSKLKKDPKSKGTITAIFRTIIKQDERELENGDITKVPFREKETARGKTVLESSQIVPVNFGKIRATISVRYKGQ